MDGFVVEEYDKTWRKWWLAAGPYSNTDAAYRYINGYVRGRWRLRRGQQTIDQG